MRKVSPTFSPEKLRMGRGVSSDLMERESEVWEREKEGSLRLGLEEKWWDLEEKREEEKKEREREEEVEVAIVDVVGGLRVRLIRCRERRYRF